MWPEIKTAIWPIVRARIRLVGGRVTPIELSIRFSISTPMSESSPRSVSGWSSRRVSGLTRSTEPTTSCTAWTMTPRRSSAGAASILPRQSPGTGTRLIRLDTAGEDAFEQRVLAEPTERLAPLRPVDTDGCRLWDVGVNERFEQCGDLVRLDRVGALAGEEFGHLLVAGDVAFTTEHTPVDREAR